MKITLNNILNYKNYQINNIKPTAKPSFGVLMAQSSDEDVFMRPFETKIGIEAMAMNKIAVNNLKNPKPVDCSRASKNDLKRMLSVKLEDSYKRCFWTNPKDGKKYIILEEEGRSEDKVPVRILDSECVFVKNAVLKPVKVVIMDTDFKIAEIPCENSKPTSLSHMQLVETFAKRNNPFANYETRILKTNKDGSIKLHSLSKELKDILSKVEKREEIFAINCSFGYEESGLTKNEINPNFIEKYKKDFKNIKLYEKIANEGVRVFRAGGNCFDDKSFDEVTIGLFANGTEGVGGLGNNGMTAYYTSRNAALVQHYEKADGFNWKVCSINTGEIDGINITGIWGTDFKCNPKIYKPAARISGTSLATPIRTAKLALNKMMEDVID